MTSASSSTGVWAARRRWMILDGEDLARIFYQLDLLEMSASAN
jgi:hypothetical protein